MAASPELIQSLRDLLAARREKAAARDADEAALAAREAALKQVKAADAKVFDAMKKASGFANLGEGEDLHVDVDGQLWHLEVEGRRFRAERVITA